MSRAIRHIRPWVEGTLPLSQCVPEQRTWPVAAMLGWAASTVTALPTAWLLPFTAAGPEGAGRGIQAGQFSSLRPQGNMVLLPPINAFTVGEKDSGQVDSESHLAGGMARSPTAAIVMEI